MIIPIEVLTKEIERRTILMEVENNNTVKEYMRGDIKQLQEAVKKLSLLDVRGRSCDLVSAALLIKTMPYDQACQQLKSDLTGEPETVVIEGRLRVYFQPKKKREGLFS